MTLTQTRAFLVLRYTLIAATAYLVLVEGSFALPRFEAILLIVLALASNVAITLMPDRLQRSFGFAVAVLVFDTAWVTGVLALSERFSSDFFYIYFFVLLLAAVGEKLSLVAVAAAALCGFYLYGHIAAGGSWSLWSSPSLIRLPFLFAAAVSYGYLIDRARQERRRADLQVELSRQFERTLSELRVAHTKAQESDRIKSTFLATVSHELRTPLVAIIGYVDLMLEGVYGRLGTEQEEALTRVQGASASLYQLIAGLLQASRLDLGQETLEECECDVSEVFAELRSDFPGSRSVRIYYPRQHDVPPFITDRIKLRTVLSNLLDNAVKYTERGVVTVSARYDRRRQRVELRVSDTGPGIPEEQFDRIFEAFRQGLERPETIGTGVGLGLYIARRLVTILGGEISVDSKLGEGSTFTVILPRQPVVRTTSSLGLMTAH